MKTKNFQEYLEKRLNKDEIAEIEKHALLEIKILKLRQVFTGNKREGLQ